MTLIDELNLQNASLIKKLFNMIEVLVEKIDKNEAERLKESAKYAADKKNYEEAIRMIVKQLVNLHKDNNDIIAKIERIEVMVMHKFTALGKIRSISSFFCKILRALSVARQ
jgi:hypothetical protein